MVVPSPLESSKKVRPLQTKSSIDSDEIVKSQIRKVDGGY